MGELAAEYFTPETGIEVNCTVLDEQTLREITTRDVGASGEQFDVVQIGMYETPQFGANGWLVGLNDLAAAIRHLRHRRPDPGRPQRSLGRR